MAPTFTAMSRNPSTSSPARASPAPTVANTRISVGDTILVPAGERHATYNTGTDVLRLMCFFPVSDIRPVTVEFPSWDEPEGAR